LGIRALDTTQGLGLGCLFIKAQQYLIKVEDPFVQRAPSVLDGRPPRPGFAIDISIASFRAHILLRFSLGVLIILILEPNQGSQQG
jgi:hypothetical protein